MTTETRAYRECCNGKRMAFGVNLGSDLKLSAITSFASLGNGVI